MMEPEPAAEVSLTGGASISARYNRAKPHFPPTLTMVMEAVKSLDEKNGSSVIAIRSYIRHKYPGVDPIRLKYYLKKALVKGLDKGYLIRPVNSSAQGATGRFKLVSEKSKREKAKEVESSDGETAPKPAKKKVAAVKKPRSKTPAGKPESARNPEEGKKKPKIAGPKTEPGSNTSKVSEKPKEKALVAKAAKAPKKQSAPNTSHAKPASGPKKTTSKTNTEAKGPAKSKANEGAKPPPAEKAEVPTKAAKKAKTSSVADSSKAKTSSVADSSKAKAGRSETKTKAAVPKTKNSVDKKRVAKGKKEEEEAAGVSDVDSEDM